MPGGHKGAPKRKTKNSSEINDPLPVSVANVNNMAENQNSNCVPTRAVELLMSKKTRWKSQ